MAGSLTGVVASKRVTEAFKGSLSTLGNRAQSAMAQGGLTVRPTGRAGGKPGHSDPAVPSPPRAHIDGVVWHLDVGPSHPGAGEGPKGSAVRRLKWHASWVQNVARQFGPYLLWAQEV
ncbi:MAG: hypothetical protein AUK64_2225 [bacterium P201]|nr:MAG: hypothetical protein AUK64_2225 [bacterium P201]